MKIPLLPKFKYFLILLVIIVFLLYKMNRLLIYSTTGLPPTYKKTTSVMDSMTTISAEITTIAEELTEGQFRILLWTKYFRSDVWTHLKLNELNCSYSNCILTDDRQYLNRSDALLFHWRDIKVEDLPQHHKPHQKWVLYNWESPHFTSEEVVKPLVGDIDWMMTYRKDSDIYVPYGSVQKCHRKWNNEHLFDSKSRSVAWIVSNCLTPSYREGYVKELATFIDVDIYGVCGQNECKRDESCFQMIEKKYKFYLSFENSVSFLIRY